LRNQGLFCVHRTEEKTLRASPKYQSVSRLFAARILVVSSWFIKTKLEL